MFGSRSRRSQSTWSRPAQCWSACSELEKVRACVWRAVSASSAQAARHSRRGSSPASETCAVSAVTSTNDLSTSESSRSSTSTGPGRDWASATGSHRGNRLRRRRSAVPCRPTAPTPVDDARSLMSAIAVRCPSTATGSGLRRASRAARSATAWCAAVRRQLDRQRSRQVRRRSRAPTEPVRVNGEAGSGRAARSRKSFAASAAVVARPDMFARDASGSRWSR